MEVKDFYCENEKNRENNRGKKMTRNCHNEQEDPRMAYTILIM